MKLITDGKWKHFTYGYDVPKKVLADYDHLDGSESCDQFLKYRGVWYHLSDFTVTTNNKSDLSHTWDGQYIESAFSAVVIRVSRNAETYQIGRMVWESEV